MLSLNGVQALTSKACSQHLIRLRLAPRLGRLVVWDRDGVCLDMEAEDEHGDGSKPTVTLAKSRMP